MRRLALVLVLLSLSAAARAVAPPDATLAAFRARHGQAWTLQRDAGSRRPRRLQGGAVELLTARELGTLPGDALRREAEGRVLAFVRGEAALLGLGDVELTPSRVPVAGTPDGSWLVVHLDVRAGGVRVRGGRVSAALSSGRVVHVQVVGSAPVTADPAPLTTSRAALDGALAAAGLDEDHLAVAAVPELVFVPEGQGHRLAWEITLIASPGPRRVRATVDARSGDLVSLTDETVSACDPAPPGGTRRRVLGGVRPTRADEPERVELLAFATVGTATSGPDGSFAPPGGGYSGVLDGPAISLDCIGCSSPEQALAPAGASGDVDFGTGGIDAFGNGTSRPGDRTAWFHAEGVRRHAASWISLPWLSQVLPIHSNIADSCNAYWDGSSLNFFRSSGRCANTGEIRDVINHEWGHGLDDNDGLEPPSLSVDAATGEAVADIVAMLRSRDACIGESFFRGASDFPSPTCSGVRDLDELAAGHEHGAPATLTTTNVLTKCGASGSYRGPLGREGHCEGEILGQAFWHLVQDFRAGVSYATGAPLPDGPMGDEAAWQLAERLYFRAKPLLASYAPAAMQSIGTSAYDAFLLADDEGDGVANGTPHAAAIHEAFAHHGIEEPGIPPIDTAGCAAPPEPSPSLSSPTDAGLGLSALKLDWTDVGAAAYRVLRQDAPADVATPLVTLPAGTTTFTDTGVLPGRTYRYAVIARSASGCESSGAAWAAGAPGSHLVVAAIGLEDPAPANLDGVLEPGEAGDVWVDLTNDGSEDATGVVVSLSADDPLLSVEDGGPRSYGTIAAGARVSGPAPFRIRPASGVPRFVGLTITAESAEGCLRAGHVLELGVPEITKAGETVEDVTGNLDGSWDPGETAELTVSLANDGLVDAVAVTGLLAFRAPAPTGVAIFAADGAWSRLPRDGSPTPPTLPFRLTSTGATPSHAEVALTLSLTLGGQPAGAFDIDLVVGAFPAGVKKWEYRPATHARFFTTPIVVQLDDDDGDGVVTECDVADVVVEGEESGGGPSMTHAISGATGLPLWTYTDTVDVAYDGALAAGDIDGDGSVEIIRSSGARTEALSSAGALVWTGPALNTTSITAPQAWDLEGDGTVEVISGMNILNADGTLEHVAPMSTGRALVGDLDLDGSMELIGGNGTTAATMRADGTAYPVTFPGFFQSGGLVNLDHDPLPEVVYVTREWTIVARDDDGSLLWIFDEAPPGPSGRTPTICFADFDTDGRADVVYPYLRNMTLLAPDGKVGWVMETRENSCCAGCSVFDFDRDGVAEILYRDEQNLLVIDARQGRVLWSTPVRHSTGKDVPVAADLDHDGASEILVTERVSGAGAVMAFSNPHWAAARAVWNQEDYSVTHVADDGGIVSNPVPRWLGKNDFRGQDTSCSCGGPDSIGFEWRLASCANLIACFSADGIGGLAPLTYTWDFGDGSEPVQGATPCHQYAAGGTYVVSVWVEDAARCPLQALQEVTVAPALDAVVTGRAECKFFDTCLTAVVEGGTPPYTVTWTWGDGQPDGSGLAACHAYGAGRFVVTARIEDAAGCITESRREMVVVDATALPELSARGSAEPMLVSLSEGILRFRYEDAGQESGLYEGRIAELRRTGYTHVATAACRRRGGIATTPSPTFDAYYLVAAAACNSPREEGSLGTDSFLSERPAAPVGSRCP